MSPGATFSPLDNWDSSPFDHNQMGSESRNMLASKAKLILRGDVSQSPWILENFYECLSGQEFYTLQRTSLMKTWFFFLCLFATQEQLAHRPTARYVLMDPVCTQYSIQYTVVASVRTFKGREGSKPRDKPKKFCCPQQEALFSWLTPSKITIESTLDVVWTAWDQSVWSESRIGWAVMASWRLRWVVGNIRHFFPLCFAVVAWPSDFACGRIISKHPQEQCWLSWGAGKRVKKLSVADTVACLLLTLLWTAIEQLHMELGCLLFLFFFLRLFFFFFFFPNGHQLSICLIALNSVWCDLGEGVWAWHPDLFQVWDKVIYTPGTGFMAWDSNSGDGILYV